jgi:hypothetical protein
LSTQIPPWTMRLTWTESLLDGSYGDSRPPPISPPIAAFSIMSTRIDFIGHTLILIRTLRLSMRDLLWGFDTTIRLGDGISKNVTWIQLCRRMTEVEASTKTSPAGRFCWTFGQISGQRAVGIAQPRSLPTQSRGFVGPSRHFRVYPGTSTRSSDR